MFVSTQRVTDALLRKPVLPNGGRAFEKVSAAIAVRTALRARTSEQTLIYLVPEATASTARHIAAALLVGNYAHQNGAGELPSDEVRPLLKGDVLLVTLSVSDCKEELDALPIGPYQRLKDFWEVIPLSKYTKPKADKPRVFLANPGWMLAGAAAARRFGAVIIDASHPRAYEHLPELLRLATGCTSIRLVVSPPMNEATLKACGYPQKAAIWVWDPQAMTDAQCVVECDDTFPHQTSDRYLWVCDDDAGSAKALAHLHRQLVAATKAAAGTMYPGLPQCWSIYNRLRQLTVPLAQLEQASSQTWGGSLRERIETLAEVHGHGNVAWDTTWPGLVDAVKTAYQTLATRAETAKFWAVAAKLEEFLSSAEPSLRIVIASQKEGELFLQLLSQVVDGVGQALAEGRLEIVTGSAEARLVCEGQVSPTVLLGPRPMAQRYLDVFPSRRIDEYVYPHEVQVEKTAQVRLYEGWSQAAADDKRLQLLAPLGFKPPREANTNACSPRPNITVGRTNGHSVQVTTAAEVSSVLDLEFADDYEQRAEGGSTTTNGGLTAQTGDVVEVTFTRGGARRYYALQNVDVFFTESGHVQRHPARSLKTGWMVIEFVDGQYEGLFKRFTEVVHSRLPTHARVVLELWQAAKDDLWEKHQDKRVLYAKLQSQGLQSSNVVFHSWFWGEEGTLAPLHYDEFEVLAKECDTYRTTPALLKTTFEAVKRFRGRNRVAGRALRKFLRAVVSGDGHDDALESARKLDTALGDVLAAVEVLEVESVNLIRGAENGK